MSSFIEKQILGSSHWDWLCCKTTSSLVVPNDLLDPGQEAVLVVLRALVFVADNRSISETYQSHVDLFVLTNSSYLNNLFFLVSRRLHQGPMSFLVLEGTVGRTSPQVEHGKPVWSFDNLHCQSLPQATVPPCPPCCLAHRVCAPPQLTSV